VTLNLWGILWGPSRQNQAKTGVNARSRKLPQLIE
jgi:hypothetical protein